jgi:hypothetical protein
VRVYKARHEHASVRVESRLVGIGSFEFRRSANRDDSFISNHDRAVFDDAKCAEGMSALRAACESEELGGGVDEHEGFQ